MPGGGRSFGPRPGGAGPRPAPRAAGPRPGGAGPRPAPRPAPRPGSFGGPRPAPRPAGPRPRPIGPRPRPIGPRPPMGTGYVRRRRWYREPRRASFCGVLAFLFILLLICFVLKVF